MHSPRHKQSKVCNGSEQLKQTEGDCSKVKHSQPTQLNSVGIIASILHRAAFAIYTRCHDRPELYMPVTALLHFGYCLHQGAGGVGGQGLA